MTDVLFFKFGPTTITEAFLSESICNFSQPNQGAKQPTNKPTMAEPFIETSNMKSSEECKSNESQSIWMSNNLVIVLLQKNNCFLNKGKIITFW